MPIHVKAFQPETALRDLIDSSLKSNINGIPSLSVKRRQLLGSKFFHFILSYDDILISLFTLPQPVKRISTPVLRFPKAHFAKVKAKERRPIWAKGKGEGQRFKAQPT
jgi:hypothetical protein